MAIFFTDTGQSFHDSDWQPAGTFGTNSNLSIYGTHGCIHTPFEKECWLYNWIDTGTPVLIYPGDGRLPAAQLQAISVDDSGQPLGWL